MPSSTPTIVVVGSNHEYAPVEIRERLAFSGDELLEGLDALHLTLQPDPSAPKPVQEASAAFILKRGSGLVVPMEARGKNLETGGFRTGGWEGQVSGLELMFGYGRSVSGTMTLQDDNALAGVVRAENGTTQFLASARLR